MNKIIIAVILVVMTFGIFTVCEADVPDISGLTDTELFELRSKINTILEDSLNVIPKWPIGYEVGVDIPEGKYQFSATEFFFDNAIKVYFYDGDVNDLYKFVSDDELMWNVEHFRLYGENDVFLYDLKTGMHLLVEDGEVHLEKIN